MKWIFWLKNVISLMTFIFIMVVADIKIHGYEVKLTNLLIPMFCAILIGSIITHLSLKRTEYLEEKVREKTRELEDYARKLEHYAAMDDMTNTYNRRMGLEMLKNHYALSIRGRRSLSVCFVDIDGLKSVNDNFGHARGDRLIKDVSQMLISSVRESDIVARFGGDEFLIVLPECGIEGAGKVMERLVERLEVYNEISSKGYRASVSYGIAESSDSHREPVEKLLVEADNRMYSMKKQRKKKLFRSQITLDKIGVL